MANPVAPTRELALERIRVAHRRWEELARQADEALVALKAACLANSLLVLPPRPGPDGVSRRHPAQVEWAEMAEVVGRDRMQPIRWANYILRHRPDLIPNHDRPGGHAAEAPGVPTSQPGSLA